MNVDIRRRNKMNKKEKKEICKWIEEHGEIFFNEPIIIYSSEDELILKALKSFINKYEEE